MALNLKVPQGLLGSPYDTDRTTKVTVTIDGSDYDKIEVYSYTSDILSLGDPFSVVIPNPQGAFSKFFAMGQTFKLFMADPAVSGGQKVQKVTGRVISRQSVCSKEHGTTITVGGADLGWHLQSTCGQLNYRAHKIAWSKLIHDLLDAGWGLKLDLRLGNEFNRLLKLGRSFAQAHVALAYKAIPPPFQIEAGEILAGKLIYYAKLEQKLLNVSADGFLQIWSPDYSQEPLYKFYNYAETDSRRTKNNLESASVQETIDGIYSKVTCVGQIINVIKSQLDSNNPNAGRTYGTYEPSPNPLGFNRLDTFGDSEQTDNDQAATRAKWKWKRGQYDSWTYTIEVKGHVQAGNFYETDTMCEVHDTVNGVEGKFYIAGVRYSRTKDKGTRTSLTIKKPNLLSA